MLGVMRLTFDEEEASMSGEEDFFSVARTMPLLALMPRLVTPWLTALSAYSRICVSVILDYEIGRCLPICTSFPLRFRQHAFTQSVLY